MKIKVNSIFISDVHLGLKKSKVKKLAKFLDKYEANYYYLVGDIIDIWKLKRSWYWPQEHSEIIRKILKIARKKKVVFIPGNHDEAFREFVNHNFGGVDIVEEAEHITKDGCKIVIFHGDKFDKIVLHHKWLAVLGSVAYMALLELNEVNNWVRERLNLSPWSLSMYLKHQAKEAVGMMETFKTVCSEYAWSNGYDMAITGHIHKPELTCGYANCGDWIENCSAIVENLQGDLEIVTQ
jgi:UDP-2,3-diacylglucosamine pyrophosphatase LpxH